MTMRPIALALACLLVTAAPAAADEPARLYAAYTQAAGKGDPAALVHLGAMHEYGLGTERNFAKAFGYYKQAAEQGEIQAQFRLGHMYEHGLGTPADPASALRWYTRAAERGDLAQAHYMVASMHDRGTGTRVDKAEALKWYERAADQNHADAIVCLGLMLDHGDGIAPNDAMAAVWFQRGALQDDPASETCLGLMYYKGEGVPQSYAKAAEWFKKAADRNYPQAYFNPTTGTIENSASAVSPRLIKLALYDPSVGVITGGATGAEKNIEVTKFVYLFIEAPPGSGSNVPVTARFVRYASAGEWCPGCTEGFLFTAHLVE